MNLLLRSLALGVGPVIIVAGVGMAALRSTVIRQLEAAIPVASASCSMQPVFKLAYQRGDNVVVSQGEGFKFSGEAWIEAELCSVGLLKITADGDVALNKGPQLTVVLGTTVLATPVFDDIRTVRINVPHSGRIYLGFLNDYYLADVRIAYLDNIKFIAENCRGFKSVNVPKESAGFWYPNARTASLVRAVPMTLVPCGAGELSMQIKGREGNGAFPQLIFRQGREIVKTLQTSAEWEDFHLPLESEDASITIANPYAATLADRNLNVRRLEFIPRQP